MPLSPNHSKILKYPVCKKGTSKIVLPTAPFYGFISLFFSDLHIGNQSNDAPFFLPFEGALSMAGGTLFHVPQMMYHKCTTFFNYLIPVIEIDIGNVKKGYITRVQFGEI